MPVKRKHFSWRLLQFQCFLYYSMSPQLTDEDSYTEDDYSYTFEPTEISSQVHFVDPAEVLYLP